MNVTTKKCLTGLALGVVIFLLLNPHYFRPKESNTTIILLSGTKTLCPEDTIGRVPFKIKVARQYHDSIVIAFHYEEHHHAVNTLEEDSNRKCLLDYLPEIMSQQTGQIMHPPMPFDYILMTLPADLKHRIF